MSTAIPAPMPSPTPPPAPVRMPALFLGHGNPMNAIEDNVYSRAWRSVAASLPRPRSILCVSAHWYLPGSRVTAGGHPRTIHDFGGFPRPLYEVRYSAPGSDGLAARVRQLLAPAPAVPDGTWGLDHGAWSLLVHLFPEADVPVVQLSIDETRTGPEHLEIARRLRPLRDEGVLILGSGNAVHNLHSYAWGSPRRDAYPWAARFEAWLRERIEARDFTTIAAYETTGGEDADLAAPTPEHFLPLLYVLAQAGAGEAIGFPVEGFDGGSVSMLGVRVG
ncbi:MAG: 4,5-DOPA dioxygenase extradiol [Candidatus Eisenbacteria bacterium]|nr:4,5-DOPA dioxygenase extradiol [Candidatus Eisenbacteria bacterium]